MNILNGPVKMGASFLVDRNLISPGINKYFNIIVRILDHKVHIQESIRAACRSPDKLGAVADIGNKMSIHDVAVKPLYINFHALLDLFA
jgi:hypothetical protein